MDIVINAGDEVRSSWSTEAVLWWSLKETWCSDKFRHYQVSKRAIDTHNTSHNTESIRIRWYTIPAYACQHHVAKPLLHGAGTCMVGLALKNQSYQGIPVHITGSVRLNEAIQTNWIMPESWYRIIRMAMQLRWALKMPACTVSVVQPAVITPCLIDYYRYTVPA